MKRISIVLLLILSMIPIFAAEQVWFMYSTRMTDNINLGDTYYLPDYSKTWTSDKDIGNPLTGTYSTINTLGNFGVMSCEHKLRFTITTDGRFVSQSDPSKYREYYLAMRPRCRQKGGSDMDYNLGSNGTDVDSTDRLTNTRLTGSMTYITPPVSSNGSYVRINKSGTMKTIDRFHADLIVLMDELTSEDLQRLSEKDDYFTTFTIEWHCEENGCTNPNHSGHYTVVLKGYYGNQNPQYSLVSLFVKPTVTAVNLDILETIANNDGKATIANMSFYCASKSKYDWKSKVYVFLSASNSSKTTSTGFKLVNRTTNQIIPYTLNVLHGGDVVGTFDGTDSSNGKKPVHYIDFTSSQSSLIDREGTTSNSIIFDGDVQIDFGSLSESQINADLLNYGGVYTSTIYYYVVTSENNYI
ncbi:MAG: hypothetical protein IKP61_09685 [Spirochaetales bacterium]|nr:hypothetical protein [Spirochaetales bacterium]